MEDYILMWLYNESGYLVFVNLADQPICKMCNTSYKRSVEFCRYTNREFNDACPNCGHVYGSSNSMIFTNTDVRKAVI